MENKTCGECKWFVLNSEGRCRSNEGEENANNDCCSFFEQKAITNGDRIRQMSNEELAEKFVYFDYSVCDDNGMGYPWCSTLFEDGGNFETEEKAIAATLEELNKVSK